MLPSFKGVTITEPLLTLTTDNLNDESSSVLSRADGGVSFASIDANDSTDSLHEWSVSDLPSSWQAVASTLDLDSHLLPLAFDHFNDVDVTAADINDIVSNGS